MKSQVFAAIIATCMTLCVVFGMGLQCSDDSVREIGEKTQEEWMEAALVAVPIPVVEHFQTRESVAKWITRQDTPDRIYYVYVFADTGNCMGYYVAQNRPVSICCAITAPDVIDGSGSNKAVVKAPAIDGVYYNGGDDDQYYFFDAATDAMIELTGVKFITSDQPLMITADPIQVQTTS